MKSKISVKLSEEGVNFLNKISINRIKADKEVKMLPPYEALEIIANYFKVKNDEYLTMIHMEVKKK